ncbi:MAG: serine hydrolase domain-containing protein [Desulfomonilaceae bacterium]
MRFSRADEKMKQGLHEEIFTAVDLLVARGKDVLFHQTYGVLGSTGTDPVTPETLFDLASLTKVLAVTPSWILMAAEDPSLLDQSVGRWFPNMPPDKRCITPRCLLAHASGLPAWRPYYLLPASRHTSEDTAARILAEPLEYSPGDASVYSDLGFMLLGFIIEKETGRNLEQFSRERIYEPLGLADDLLFRPKDDARIAMTRAGDSPGLVNDLNARALGGVSGHAGLFGTAKGVAALAGEILMSLKETGRFFDKEATRTFCTCADINSASTRALGFDTPSDEGSTSGRLFSKDSVGHTGFTGVSLWIDIPRDLIVVLLTNRVFLGEADLRIKEFRPVLHDAVMESVLAQQ